MQVQEGGGAVAHHGRLCGCVLIYVEYVQPHASGQGG